jgi:demethylmenaquinone methyltransferase/2-methoxy-6-polyprenyl-1,4-benzoquinol methylase
MTARQLFEPLGPTYDRYSALLSFGQDPRWRRFLVSRLDVRADETVLDVATGTGLVARELVRRLGCSVVGVDQSPEMLAVARERTRGLPVELVEGRAEELPFADGEFASLTFTYLLRYVDDRAATMRELARVVRPGGTVAMLEFAVPRGVWRPLWELWVRVGLPGLGRLISPGWHEVGRFLGPSIRGFWKRNDPVELFRAAGLEDVRSRRLSLGGAIVVWGRRSGGGSKEPHESAGAGFAGAGAGN